jgi:membrane protease YdiL (CAAX protease family)
LTEGETDPLRPSQSPARWGLGEAVAAFAVGTVLSAFAAAIAENVTGYHPGQGKAIPLGVTAASLIGLWIGLLGGVWYASRTRGSGSLSRDFGLRLQWPKDVVLGIAAGLFSQYVLILLLYLPFEQLDPSLRHRLETPAKHDTAAVHGAGWVTLLILLLAIGAPLVEELFFRGLLQRSLARRFGPAVGVVGAALVFGLAHFELLQLPALIVFGLVLAILAQRTGRLGPSIVAHATFNAATVLTLTISR